MRSPGARVRKTLRGFWPSISVDEACAVRALLGARELALFLDMEPRDRRHSVDLMRWLRERTQASDALLAAALLHDVAKGPLRLGERIVFSLLEGLAPALVDRLSRERGPGWRRALWTLRHHARLGAALLVDAGTRPRVVELVARHSERGAGARSEADGELSWLRAADSAR